MVAAGSEGGEVDSPLQSDLQQNQNRSHHLFSSLGRQSSIYSLTLDEFQHTLCESGKNFGSMNMDEFLTSIWNAEEHQAVNSNNQQEQHHNNNNNNHNSSNHVGNHHQASSTQNEAVSKGGGIARQHSLARQGSLTLPAPLCRKTVEEVWSEIHGGNQGQGQGNSNSSKVQNSGNAQRQPTFGEMTLEDFLVKAGVVREQGTPPAPPPPQQQHQPQFGLYLTSNNPAVAPNFTLKHTQYPTVADGLNLGEPSAYPSNGKKSGYPQPNPAPAPAPAPLPVVCYNGRWGNGGPYGPPQSMGVVAPMSPVSSDSMCPGPVESAAAQFGIDMGGLRGRKRIIDGPVPVEKVVERRQRRMIKNRESAARSRARKQAYTVELEAELNQLKQENAQLKQALADLERKRKQQYFEEWKMKAQTKAQKAREKLRVIRRNLSGPL